MRSSGRLSSDWRLYVIIDAAVASGQDVAELAAAAIRGGADVIQLRGKDLTAKRLLKEAARCAAIAREAGVPLIINDRPDIAQAAGADGVHLGQDDLPVAAARGILGTGRLVGKSTHSLAQALAAEEEGADYIACGPVFATLTKPESRAVGLSLVRDVTARARVPVVCIGGIDQDTVASVLEAGAHCVAVVRAVCGAPDPERAARRIKAAVAHFDRASGAPRL